MADIDHSLIWASGTIAVYFLSLRLFQATRFTLLHPVLVAIATLIALLSILKVDYRVYMEGGGIVSFFLGPAVTALGVLLYEHYPMIRRRGLAISSALLGGSITGILSAAGIAWVLGASDDIVLSLAPKSVTTPIAIGIVKITGGIDSLTAAIVIAVGVFGAALGPMFLRFFRIRGPVAVGMAMGAAAHGIGTARAIEEGPDCGAASALAMCLNGLITALIAPHLVKLFL